MSSQKGNTRRTRPQKYQNQYAFKNSMHDTSKRTKAINSMHIVNVCERCKKIIEWKIKYKKYKPLKAPAKCNKCEQKTIKQAYHTVCYTCAKENKVCPKCGTKSELVSPELSKEEELELNSEMQSMLKSLSERKRRTFIRYMNKKKKSSSKTASNADKETDETDAKEDESVHCTQEHLFNKLKSLVISDEGSDDEISDEISDDESTSDLSEEN